VRGVAHDPVLRAKLMAQHEAGVPALRNACSTFPSETRLITTIDDECFRIVQPPHAAARRGALPERNNCPGTAQVTVDSDGRQ